MQVKVGRQKALSVVLILFVSSLFTSAAITLADAENTTWTVDDDSPEADFSSIQAAINAAANGDTIHVRAGQYYEHVVINKQVKLRGENKTSIIDGGFTGDVVRVMANNVEISGFTIQNSGKRFVTDVLPPPGFPIYEYMCGVYVYGYTGANISGNLIINNFVGFNIESTSNVLVSKNQIMNNYGDCGIRIAFSSSVTLSKNSITLNHNCGAVVFQCTASIVSENQIVENFGQGGMVISFSSRFITVSKNNITGNAFHGLNLVNAYENNVFGNNMSSNYYGVCLSGSSSNKVYENYMQANYYAVAFYDSSTKQVYNNELVNNTNDVFTLISNTSSTSDPFFPSPTPFPSTETSPDSPIKIKILSPESVLYQKGLTEATKDIPLRFTVNEPVSWMAYSLDQKTNVTISGNTTLNRLIEGSHSTIVYVKDANGNSYSSGWVQFKVASTPSVTINSPRNATSYATNNILVNITAVTPIGGVEFIEYQLEDTNYSGVINGVSLGEPELGRTAMLLDLPNGNYILIVTARAGLTGAVGSSTVYFTVDSQQTASSPSTSLSPSESPASSVNQPQFYFSSQQFSRTNTVLSLGLNTKETFQKTLISTVAVACAGLLLYFKKRKKIS